MNPRKYDSRRARLVKELISRGITDENVLQAIGTVQRERFVHPNFVARAYEDDALPISSGQTISQPYTVAFMTSLLDVKAGYKILEVGTGSGYQAAILNALGARVFSIERQPELHYSTQKLFDALGLSIATILGDGSIGWNEYAPYNGIIVTAGSPDVPPSLTKQLAIGGKLVIPVGDEEKQILYVITRLSDDKFDVQEYNEFRFVPLIGKEGWKFENYN